MKKIFVLSFIYLIIYSCAPVATKPQPAAEEKSVVAVPVDPDVTIGKLDNGLTYYIRSNKKPENRAEMLLVVNAGSVLETDIQQGLAHFVEHMAFNGTKNFPKQDLVDYLESIGLEFGPDLNAYTSFDETVYMLQVPTDDSEKLGKAFQILGDWAHDITFDNEEIDKERGVVVEEWRLRSGAWKRMIDKQLPVILHGSKYADRLPIGQKAVIDTFKYETAKNFYHTWYKPELMAVIAVGDFEKSDIENLINQNFSSIKKSAQPRTRSPIPVPDHDETLITIASDPEAPYSHGSIVFKYDRKKNLGSKEAFRDGIIFNLFNNMLNNRLKELTKTADPPFLYVNGSKGSWVQGTQMFTLEAVVNTNGIPRGIDALLTEAIRVQKHGFTLSELDREKTKYLRNLEKKFNERDKTESEEYKWQYKDHFMDGKSIPSIGYIFETVKEELTGIGLDDVTELSIELIRDKNRVIAVSSPENDDVIIPTEADIKDVLNTVLTSDIKPYVDAVSDEPLVKSLNPPGKVVTKVKLDDIGVTQWTLANGIKVVLKPTDFKNDEILFYAHSPGGHSLVEDVDFMAARTAADVIKESGLGTFTKIELDKMLSDKIVSVSPWINELNEGLQGNVSPQDQETMFQLIYQYFNAPRSDSTSFLAYKARLEGWIENRNARPENVFRDSIQVTKAQHHLRARPWSMGLIQEMDLENSYRIFNERFSDAGDFTFFFVGNFELAAIQPIVEMYLGSLPSTGRTETWRDVGMEMPTGIVKNSVRKGIEPKSMVRFIFNGDFNWNFENRHVLKSLEGVMEIKLREIMREDMGGTYGVWIWTEPIHYPQEKYEFNIMFGCAPENVDTLTQALFMQIDSVQTYGIDGDYISKVQEKHRQAREVDLKENKFWLNSMSFYYLHGEDPLNILDFDKLVNALSVEVIQTAAREYLNSDNYVKVVLYPEVVE